MDWVSSGLVSLTDPVKVNLRVLAGNALAYHYYNKFHISLSLFIGIYFVPTIMPGSGNKEIN